MFDRFVKENIERDVSHYEMTDDLYERYEKFCEYYNYRKVNRRSFGIRIVKLRIGALYKKNKKSARWGVKLLPCRY